LICGCLTFPSVQCAESILFEAVLRATTQRKTVWRYAVSVIFPSSMSFGLPLKCAPVFDGRQGPIANQDSPDPSISAGYSLFPSLGPNTTVRWLQKTNKDVWTRSFDRADSKDPVGTTHQAVRRLVEAQDGVTSSRTFSHSRWFVRRPLPSDSTAQRSFCQDGHTLSRQWLGGALWDESRPQVPDGPMYSTVCIECLRHNLHGMSLGLSRRVWWVECRSPLGTSDPKVVRRAHIKGRQGLRLLRVAIPAHQTVSKVHLTSTRQHSVHIRWDIWISSHQITSLNSCTWDRIAQSLQSLQIRWDVSTSSIRSHHMSLLDQFTVHIRRWDGSFCFITLHQIRPLNPFNQFSFEEGGQSVHMRWAGSISRHQMRWSNSFNQVNSDEISQPVHIWWDRSMRWELVHSVFDHDDSHFDISKYE
jgi:hypothetical protein